MVGRRVRAPLEDVPFHGVRPGFGFDPALRYARGAAAVLRRIEPDLIEVHERPDVALALARRFPRVALFLHSDPQDLPGAGTGDERTELGGKLTAIVTVSEYVRARFLEAAEAEVTVLPGSIDVPPRFRRVRDRLILFVGPAVHATGADAFVKACAAVLPELPGWRAEMVGPDGLSAGGRPTPYQEQLHQRAADAGVAMSGPLPHEDTMERMSRAAIVVVPSRRAEPFGLTALEAMAHGAALICSPSGALPELAGDCALYASPDAPGALAGAMLQLAGDTGSRSKYGSGARIRAEWFDTAAAAYRLTDLRRALAG